MVFISTDFVFDGTNAPYDEQAATSPLNTYGRQKAEAEKAVLSASADHIILRVPILYGIAAGLEKSLLITSSLKPVKAIRPTKQAGRKMPTWRWLA
jgi:dTDP-4-dehydrorhamnose reductase